jgi:hypothetical protein
VTTHIDDPVDVLGVTDDPSVAAALLALAGRYEEQAPAIAGTGADLLARAAGDGRGPVDAAALRQALAPRLRALAGASAALESLARSSLPAGDLLAAARLAGTAAAPPGRWPVVPAVELAREVLSGWARARPRVPDDLFEGELAVADASVARLTVTRVFRRVTEERMWTGDAPPELETYEGDLDELAGSLDDRGWADARWEGIKAGSVERRNCGRCEGEGRVRCPRCNGGAFERCRQFEPCGTCHGTGKGARQRGAWLRPVCAVCNGRGAVPCALCGGFGRRPCEACTGGLIVCDRCHGHGRVTQYELGVIERWAEVHAEVDRPRLDRLGRGVERHFRTVATVTRPRPVAGMPERLHDAVRRLLERQGPEQLRQRVRIEVLPAAEVTYQHGQGAGTAWLLGDGEDVEVRVPGVGRPGVTSRLRRPLVAALVAAAAIVATVVVLLAARGGA